jgi:hypothetical protein
VRIETWIRGQGAGIETGTGGQEVGIEIGLETGKKVGL